MALIKLIKTNAYFKRFQVKYRRRRAGKTDYHARRGLVIQDKNKYGTPKYRLVVRLTDKYVICQVVKSEIVGDKVFASANSAELAQFGLTVGLKNYAAAYATGLLVARRVNALLNLSDVYEGNTDVTGEVVKTTHAAGEGKSNTFYVAEVDDEKRPFRCYLDVGTRATTTGARVFGALKGAVDGGLDIPHNERRFPGYDRDGKTFDADEMKARIFGEHVADYQNFIRDDDNEEYQKRFSKYVEAGVEPDDIPELFESVHEKIRENPGAPVKKAFKSPAEFTKPKKFTLEQRKANLAAKKADRLAKLQAALDE